MFQQRPTRGTDCTGRAERNSDGNGDLHVHVWCISSSSAPSARYWGIAWRHHFGELRWRQDDDVQSAPLERARRRYRIKYAKNKSNKVLCHRALQNTDIQVERTAWSTLEEGGMAAEGSDTAFTLPRISIACTRHAGPSQIIFQWQLRVSILSHRRRHNGTRATHKNTLSKASACHNQQQKRAGFREL